MSLSRSINKRKIIVLLSLVFLILAFTVIHNVYAGKPTINLNSPVSFPVDI